MQPWSRCNVLNTGKEMLQQSKRAQCIMACKFTGTKIWSASRVCLHWGGFPHILHDVTQKTPPSLIICNAHFKPASPPISR